MPIDNDSEFIKAVQCDKMKKETKKWKPIMAGKSELIPMGETAPDADSIEESFSKIQNRNEAVEVLKELFDGRKIYMITDLSQEQINIATRIYMCAKIKNIPIWEDGLLFFVKLLLSKNRQSRKELLDGMKAYESSKQQSMNPFFNQYRGNP